MVLEFRANRPWTSMIFLFIQQFLESQALFWSFLGAHIAAPRVGSACGWLQNPVEFPAEVGSWGDGENPCRPCDNKEGFAVYSADAWPNSSCLYAPEWHGPSSALGVYNDPANMAWIVFRVLVKGVDGSQNGLKMVSLHDTRAPFSFRNTLGATKRNVISACRMWRSTPSASTTWTLPWVVSVDGRASPPPWRVRWSSSSWRAASIGCAAVPSAAPAAAVLPEGTAEIGWAIFRWSSYRNTSAGSIGKAETPMNLGRFGATDVNTMQHKYTQVWHRKGF